MIKIVQNVLSFEKTLSRSVVLSQKGLMSKEFHIQHLDFFFAKSEDLLAFMRGLLAFRPSKPIKFQS